MSLTLINLILAPNSSNKFSLKLEMPREERSCPYLKDSMIKIDEPFLADEMH